MHSGIEVVVQYPPANNPMHPSGEVGRFQIDNLSSPPGDWGRSARSLPRRRKPISSPLRSGILDSAEDEIETAAGLVGVAGSEMANQDSGLREVEVESRRL
jgi:hypothetical protein